eukprot:m.84607 g.84607  ORF g.84607 m.84607 type:complete len:132 (-) comp12973_c0_seq4:1978-2373(-)
MCTFADPSDMPDGGSKIYQKYGLEPLQNSTIEPPDVALGELQLKLKETHLPKNTSLTKGEKALMQNAKPCINFDLPSTMRTYGVCLYDFEKYSLYNSVIELLRNNPSVGGMIIQTVIQWMRYHDRLARAYQ